MMKVASLWSGGKDSCFACYKAIKLGYKVLSLFNFTDIDGVNSLSHGLPSGLLRKQAELTNMPFLQKAMPMVRLRSPLVLSGHSTRFTRSGSSRAKSRDEVEGPKQSYRDEFKALISDWKKKAGIEGIVFGDIYLQEHKDWIDKVCKESQVKAILPLWGQNTRKLIAEFIGLGFEAIVVTTRKELLGKEWLGRKIDKKFIEELGDKIDPCGENGEFHTFVYNGPLFKKQIEIAKSSKALKGNRWFLKILDWKVVLR